MNRDRTKQRRDLGGDLPLRLPRDARTTELKVGETELRVIRFSLDAAPVVTSSLLSPAELEVTELALRGSSNAEIAAQRGRHVRTVANQMAAIFRKLGVGSRRELTARHLRAPVPPTAGRGRDDETYPR